MSEIYEECGVNIDLADAFVDAIKEPLKDTHDQYVQGGVGGFAALYQFPHKTDTLLVASTDGVGSKVELAKRFDNFDTIGIDLVAMVMNDIAVTGATPLFMLDYYACHSLRGCFNTSHDIIMGISQGCQIANCALIGGETAELPGTYKQGDFDLAGFGIGMVKREHLLGRHKVKEGDVLIGVASAGPHSNGYSVINKIPDAGPFFLTPTLIYTSLIQKLTSQYGNEIVHAAAHITGGGLINNIQRVVPAGMTVHVDWTNWEFPDWGNLIINRTGMDIEEFRQVFNSGIGMTLIVARECVDVIRAACAEQGHVTYTIGHLY